MAPPNRPGGDLGGVSDVHAAGPRTSVGGASSAVGDGAVTRGVILDPPHRSPRGPAAISHRHPLPQQSVAAAALLGRRRCSSCDRCRRPWAGRTIFSPGPDLPHDESPPVQGLSSRMTRIRRRTDVANDSFTRRPGSVARLTGAGANNQDQDRRSGGRQTDRAGQPEHRDRGGSSGAAGSRREGRREDRRVPGRSRGRSRGSRS